MIIDRIAKINNFRCFKNAYAGFDRILPINIIIGKNNSGKSCLLDFVKYLTTGNMKDIAIDAKFEFSKILEEEELKRVFRTDSYGGALGNQHWDNHGICFVGKKVHWELNNNVIEEMHLNFDHTFRCSRDSANARFAYMKDLLKQNVVPFNEKIFRRLQADRDIVMENSAKELVLAENGSGATNIIRRYINSSKLSRDLIQNDLLEALNKIFGADAQFSEIQVKEHDEDNKHWEVYLGEKEKGLIRLSQSGSGLKTVLLVLLNLLVIPKLENKPECNYIYAFEELENNLHPSLLRRLLDYIHNHAIGKKCYIFLTTHSSTMLNIFYTNMDAQIIHLTHNGISAITQTIDAFTGNLNILADIGAKPSDLLQANCIVWLEGPSDRIYFNRWIDLYSEGRLLEGRDYQCAYYGGSLLAGYTLDKTGNSTPDKANLLKVNRNAILIADGDRTSPSGKGSRIKKRTSNIANEIEALTDSYIWITEAKEIENYIPKSVLEKVFEKSGLPEVGRYEIFFHDPAEGKNNNGYWQKHHGKKTFDKVDFASKIAPLLEKEELARKFELDVKMKEICTRIEQWNA